MTRRIHLVGTTFPGPPRDVLASLIDRLGRHLHSLPEESSRPNWVIEMVETRGNNPYLRTVRRSRLSKPRALRPVLDPPRYVVRGGHALISDELGLPYAAEAAKSAPLIAALAAHYELPDLRPQYGIPGPLDVAAFSWLRPLAFYDVEAQAAREQVAAIHKLTDGRALYQLEIPLETVAVARAPRSLQPRAADAMARRACDFISGTPEGSEWVIHLCVGNKNDEPLIDLRDTGPLVCLANALAEHWPASQVLHGVHMPFGNSRSPVPTASTYYAPLRDLVLHPSVHLSAGFVRADVRSTDRDWNSWKDRHGYALAQVEHMAGRGEVGVSTPCGWGRQDGVTYSTMQLLLAVASFT